MDSKKTLPKNSDQINRLVEKLFDSKTQFHKNEIIFNENIKEILKDLTNISKDWIEELTKFITDPTKRELQLAYTVKEKIELLQNSFYQNERLCIDQHSPDLNFILYISEMITVNFNKITFEIIAQEFSSKQVESVIEQQTASLNPFRWGETEKRTVKTEKVTDFKHFVFIYTKKSGFPCKFSTFINPKDGSVEIYHKDLFLEDYTKNRPETNQVQPQIQEASILGPQEEK